MAIGAAERTSSRAGVSPAGVQRLSRRTATPTDFQIPVECHRIQMDRHGLFSKLLLGVVALVVALPLFWLAGGINWLDTKIFPPRRPKRDATECGVD